MIRSYLRTKCRWASSRSVCSAKVALSNPVILSPAGYQQAVPIIPCSIHSFHIFSYSESVLVEIHCREVVTRLPVISLVSFKTICIRNT